MCPLFLDVLRLLRQQRYAPIGIEKGQALGESFFFPDHSFASIPFFFLPVDCFGAFPEGYVTIISFPEAAVESVG